MAMLVITRWYGIFLWHLWIFWFMVHGCSELVWFLRGQGSNPTPREPHIFGPEGFSHPYLLMHPRISQVYQKTLNQLHETWHFPRFSIDFHRCSMDFPWFLESIFLQKLIPAGAQPGEGGPPAGAWGTWMVRNMEIPWGESLLELPLR